MNSPTRLHTLANVRRNRRQMRFAAVCLSVTATILLTPCLLAQTDPGPRGGTASAGGFFPGLNGDEQQLFNEALAVFAEIDSVSGTVAGEDGSGLGPTYNASSCADCHAEPAVGGSSPGLNSRLNPVPNPQIELANRDGARNSIPSFVTPNGPIREARFVLRNTANPNAGLDGGVHDLYTIAGRSDAPGCNAAQPNFAQQLASNNVIFRIPTPTFGLGLVENTSDATLQANLAANASAKSALGIKGHLNTSGNDGTVTRFGWKAQNKSLLIFAGEAYNVEQGVSNEAFQNERAVSAGCVFNATPEDHTHIRNDAGSLTGTATEMSGDAVSFANFMRLLAPPTPAPLSASATRGQTLFSSVGCVLCHTANLTTDRSIFSGMSNVTYHPYSDFAVHHMGGKLTDGTVQGGAGPDEFRTAPLWGLGQRLFFLHDGRTTDLMQAIAAHSTPAGPCTSFQDFRQFTLNGVFLQPFVQEQYCAGSEANGVISNFNALTATQKQDVLNFLRSL